MSARLRLLVIVESSAPRPARGAHLAQDSTRGHYLRESGYEAGRNWERLSTEMDVLCFEMEASGLMKNPPCQDANSMNAYTPSGMGGIG